MRTLRGIAVAIGVLLAVYLPTNAVVFLTKSDLLGQISVTIAVSLALACLYLALASSRHPQGAAAYGFAAAPIRHMLWALAAGIVLGSLTRLFLAAVDVRLPFDTDGFETWQIILLFWIAAPVQEEVIFRGLLQGSLASRLGNELRLGTARLSPAAIFAATLFALVHVPVGGPALGLGTMALGLAAGHLRWVSGSLAPAILVHALFNVIST